MFSLVMAPLILLCIVVAFFSDVLFLPGDRVLSKEGTDLFSQFIYFRDFGFSELKAGNLALWNPHIFSGMPFLGGFQSALLYPPNLIYLMLPLAKAINVGIALHVFLAGVFMYAWTFHRGLHPFACLFSAILFMFCGAHFPHIYAGHLPNLCTMIWAPLVLLAVDGLAEKRPIGWCLLGVFAVAMQLLAGHPQYAFYTAMTCVIYAGFLVAKCKNKGGVMLGLLLIYVGAAALSAVQLLPGIEAGAESIRSGDVSYQFAAMFSLPPENLATLLAPALFGDMSSVKYWGRCYLWEMSLFFSVTGFVLSLLGAIFGDRSVRRFSIIMVVILLVLALGAHTPLFKILYSFAPGFDKFRGNSKFIFFASLYLLMLCAIGFDWLIKKRQVPRKVTISSFVIALLFTAFAIGIWYSSTRGGLEGMWARALLAVQGTGESYLPAKTYVSLPFVKDSGAFASKALLMCSGTWTLLGVIFLLTRFSRRAVYMIGFLAVAEIIYFAEGFRPTFDLRSTYQPQIAELGAKISGDDRILNLIDPNSAMSFKMDDIWGYDPGVLSRYAQFMNFTQGRNPDKATQYLRFSRYHQLYKMLRCRYVIGHRRGKIRILEFKDVMPKISLLYNYQVISDRNRIFSALGDPSFDPRTTVILEAPPGEEPVKSEKKGIVSVIEESTDHMMIEADLPTPAILLITNTYSKGWHVCGLPGSDQQSYQVMAANYVLCAIPLASGHHRFLLEYSPIGFRVGKWISIISVLLYLCVLFWYLHRRRKSEA